MSIWFLLWLVLSAALLYFLGWTLFILYRQKRAWKAYAAARKLRYSSSKMLASPEMSGIVNDYTVSFFASEHGALDARTTRKLTAIEINLSGGMPFDSGIGSFGMVSLIRLLNLREEFYPSHLGWDKTWIAATSSHAGLEAYLTPERQEALVSLMKLKSAWIIFIFRGDVMLLRLDTPDPLDHPKKIDQLVKKLTDAAKILELKSGEEAQLKVAMSRPQVRGKLAAPEVAPTPVSLELETEERSPENKE